jgi:nitrogen regulatory protein PII
VREPMKLIVAVVLPETLEAVQEALAPLGAQLISVSRVLGGGLDPGYTEIYRGRTVHVRRPQVRLEVAADDASAELVVQAILRAGAANDESGDNDVEVVVMQMAGSIRTRAGDQRPVAACT